jgi:hypothetical protein
MKYLKLYESFILESQSETSIIKLYPEEQIFDKSKKSILLIPGGEVGKPEVDYSKIAPGLVDTFNVYSCNWPEEINVKEFAMNLSEELTNIGKFTIGGFSFGCPIAFHLANILENNGNKNFLKTVFFIDGGAPVNSPEEQKTNIVLMNPPRARCAKRFDFYCQDLRDNKVNLSPDLKLPLEPKAVESEALKNFGTQWNSTVKVDADFTKTNTTFDEKEYNNWKSGKQVLEFLGETTIPTIEDIKQLITDKKFKEESVWIVEDKFPTQEILTHYGLNITDWLGQPKAGESFVELDIRGKMQFAEKQITTKTDWYREGITLKSKCILFIAEIDKVFNKSVKDGKIIQNGVEENRKPTSKSEELILCKGVDHNHICEESFTQIIDKIKSIPNNKKTVSDDGGEPINSNKIYDHIEKNINVLVDAYLAISTQRYKETFTKDVIRKGLVRLQQECKFNDLSRTKEAIKVFNDLMTPMMEDVHKSKNIETWKLGSNGKKYYSVFNDFRNMARLI